MGWIYLLLAVFFELCGTFSMKESAGFKNLVPSILIFVFYSLCLWMMTLATTRVELSIVYSVWAGLGTAIVAGVGIFFYRESADWIKLGSIALIILGVIGLNWVSYRE
jgi:small multidrug resistance pump